MEKKDFEFNLDQLSSVIEQIRDEAHALHASVNQQYGDGLPYGYHLDMTADNVKKFAWEICEEEADILPMIFAAYYHDSIEDARLTYNDVHNRAKNYMNEEKALLATEIVYALTNEKGRTRAERADERYYSLIRSTPYAPLVKLADRLANLTYSHRGHHLAKPYMENVYRYEMPDFLQHITSKSDDPRLGLSEEMLQSIELLITE